MRFGPLLFAACLTPAPASAADADLILHHGKIVTVDGKFSLAEAVAVRGGRITAVGTDQAVLAAERGASTRLIDLQGRTVLPGLIDSHVHALSAGVNEFQRVSPPPDFFAGLQGYIREPAKPSSQGP